MALAPPLHRHDPHHRDKHIAYRRRNSHKDSFAEERAFRSSRLNVRNVSDLPNEILGKIFSECHNVHSILHFAAASKHLRRVWANCRRVEVLQRAAAVQYAPFDDAVQLVTFNTSEPAHMYRSPAVSMALVKQVVKVGNTANAWLEIYPQLRWADDNASDRRLLNNNEASRFRKALYRFWLYGTAFHDPAHSHYFMSIRPLALDVRLMFVRCLSTKDIIECGEVHQLIHQFVCTEICPSNSRIQTHYDMLSPGADPIYFGTYTSTHDLNHSSFRQPRDLATNLARESWGSEAAAYSKAADVMKLNPAQLLWIKEHLLRRIDRLDYFNTLEAFQHRPATFRAALDAVMLERGEGGLGDLSSYEGWAGILHNESLDLLEYQT